jgi:hypothetical protein
MKLKIQRKRFESGTYYYLVYEWFWFHWVRHSGSGLFDTLEEAETCAVSILEDEKERRKNKKEIPVYYKLDGNRIICKKGDGNEKVMDKPPLKLKKHGNHIL